MGSWVAEYLGKIWERGIPHTLPAVCSVGLQTKRKEMRKQTDEGDQMHSFILKKI